RIVQGDPARGGSDEFQSTNQEVAQLVEKLAGFDGGCLFWDKRHHACVYIMARLWGARMGSLPLRYFGRSAHRGSRYAFLCIRQIRVAISATPFAALTSFYRASWSFRIRAFVA